MENNNTKTQVNVTIEEQLKKITSQVYNIVSLQTQYFDGHTFSTKHLCRELNSLSFDSNNDRFRTYAKFAKAYKDLDVLIKDYVEINEVIASKECFESLYEVICRLINDKTYSNKFINDNKPLYYKYNYIRTHLINKLSSVNDKCFWMVLGEDVKAINPADIYQMPACYVEICD